MSDWRRLVWLSSAALAVACSDGGGNGTADAGNGGTDGGTGPDAGIDAGTDAGFDAGPVVATTTVDVSDVFEPGTSLRDAYSGGQLVVSDDGTVEVPLTSRKLALLEREGSQPTPFSWDNATVYFMMTDRFENGDPNNDDNFGRVARTGEGETVGTFHGGDFAGIIDRIDHLADLGVDALWITPPVEQIRGWVGGQAGEFQHFPYHGYWAGDFTKLDPNYGTEEELRQLVSAAHDRGIRVLFDMVMNHSGYLTLYDASLWVPSAVQDGAAEWKPSEGQDWNSFNDLQLLDYNDANLVDWWGPDWVRTDFPFHEAPDPSDPLKESLAFLPDFRTEVPDPVELPTFLENKTDTEAQTIENASLRDYLVAWHTRWIRDFGIDGFRCDTAKHVEFDSWTALKTEAVQALREWKANNPDDALDDLDFWMVAEAFPPLNDPVGAYFAAGFDGLINFDFESRNPSFISEFNSLDAFYEQLANRVRPEGQNYMTYASSHDTSMFFERTNQSMDAQFDLAAALLMNPGAVQVYYGDETARTEGPDVLDRTNPLRSDMNWEQITGERQELLEHWQRVGRFRRNHRAVGAGSHTRLTTEGDPAYAFARQYDDGGVVDDVVVVLGQ